MAGGTSVRGLQLLIDNGDFRAAKAFLNVPALGEVPPSRLGWAYIIMRRAHPSTEAVMISSFAVFGSGFYVLVPRDLAGGENAFQMWMAWNTAGLTWGAEFYT